VTDLFLGEGDRFSTPQKKLTDMKKDPPRILVELIGPCYIAPAFFFSDDKEKEDFSFMFAQQGKVVRNSARALFIFLLF
jgi:hypothetical protein